MSIQYLLFKCLTKIKRMLFFSTKKNDKYFPLIFKSTRLLRPGGHAIFKSCCIYLCQNHSMWLIDTIENHLILRRFHNIHLL
jgi:hypothetical protein